MAKRWILSIQTEIPAPMKINPWKQSRRLQYAEAIPHSSSQYSKEAQQNQINERSHIYHNLNYIWVILYLSLNAHSADSAHPP